MPTVSDQPLLTAYQTYADYSGFKIIGLGFSSALCCLIRNTWDHRSVKGYHWQYPSSKSFLFSCTVHLIECSYQWQIHCKTHFSFLQPFYESCKVICLKDFGWRNDGKTDNIYFSEAWGGVSGSQCEYLWIWYIFIDISIYKLLPDVWF